MSESRPQSPAHVVTWPAPASEQASDDFELNVDGTPVFVYRARVRQEVVRQPGKISSHKLGGPTEWASFVIFDFSRPVTVTVKPARPFQKATLLPAHDAPAVHVLGREIRFQMDKPRQLSLLLDDSDDRPLHLFTNTPEADAPRADDPNVLYFGPGTHEIGSTKLRSGQTVYIAGGAVVHGIIEAGAEEKIHQRTGMVTWPGPILSMDHVTNVRIAGRGILDGSKIPHAARGLINAMECSDIRIEGIVIRDSPAWHVTLRQSRRAEVAGVKLISGRLNSDGINCVSSEDIYVHDCFIRNFDDSLAVKTMNPDIEARRIRYERCVVWADWGFALGVTYETRAAISDLIYRDCDVISFRDWAMGVHVLDGATISGIRFEDIRVHRADGGGERRLTKLPILIRANVVTDKLWGTDPKRGRIRDLTFSNIDVFSDVLPASIFNGFDAEHTVSDVVLRNIRHRGRLIENAQAGNIAANEHVRNLRVVRDE